MSMSLVVMGSVNCDGGRMGCQAFFECERGYHVFAHEARKEARQAGWEVNVKSPYGRRRLDFCPSHKFKGGAV